MIQQVERLAREVGVTAVCEALGMPRSSWYTRRKPRRPKPRPPVTPPRRLSPEERTLVRQTLNSERFADQAPREVYATLLDEQDYLCSVATMYRILRDHQEIRERRNQLRHPVYVKPELVATGPNQVWTWDITKLPGPLKWVSFCLYVVLDLFSRFVVGWMVALRENGQLAEQLIAESCARQPIPRQSLSVHSDRGAPMTAKSLVLLFADLGVTQSLARPHVPDDNPYSEAQFKTLKYHPTFPERFGCLLDARAWGQQFFRWYNYEHHHIGLGLMTPATVHFGHAEVLFTQREQVLQAAYLKHPERFVKGPARPPALPSEVWINPPGPGEKVSADTQELH